MDHATADAQPVVSKAQRTGSKRKPNLFELEQTMQMALTKIEAMEKQTVRNLDATLDGTSKVSREQRLLQERWSWQDKEWTRFREEMNKRWETTGIINTHMTNEMVWLKNQLAQLKEGEALRWTGVAKTLTNLDNTLQANTAALQEASRSALECTVCLDKPRDTVILPCSHFAVCSECQKACRNCPVCRGAVNGSIKVFIA